MDDAEIAPGHCTGEPAFTALRKAFSDRYLYAGLGTTLSLSKLPNYELILIGIGLSANRK
jgi:hypothetical protein